MRYVTGVQTTKSGTCAVSRGFCLHLCVCVFDSTVRDSVFLIACLFPFPSRSRSSIRPTVVLPMFTVLRATSRSSGACRATAFSLAWSRCLRTTSKCSGDDDYPRMLLAFQYDSRQSLCGRWTCTKSRHQAFMLTPTQFA